MREGEVNMLRWFVGVLEYELRAGVPSTRFFRRLLGQERITRRVLWLLHEQAEEVKEKGITCDIIARDLKRALEVKRE